MEAKIVDETSIIPADVDAQRSIGEIYESFNLEKYNRTMVNQLNRKNAHLRNLLLLPSLTGIAFSGGPIIYDDLSAFSWLLKLNWLIPLPYFIVYNLGVQSIKDDDIIINAEEIARRKEELDGKRVFFTITTRGLNIETVEETVRSVLYWTEVVRERYGIDFESYIWVVTEEDTYVSARERYDEMEFLGVKVLPTPSDYGTENDTKFKARALNYALEIRRELGYNTRDDWIYHQDEETMVGEDTILGILDFIINSDDSRNYGAGVILYPKFWDNRVTCGEEISRTYTDFSFAGQRRLKRYSLFWYHGSHFIIRSDIEDGVGWDFGIARSEDYLFTLKLKEKYDTRFQSIKGFAYERSPFTIGDHMKQRRRWILGVFEIIKRKDVKLRQKLPAVYGLLSWYSALPSIIASLFGLLYPTGGLFVIGGIMTGLIWYTIFNTYKRGYEMHTEYIEERPIGLLRKLRLVLNMAVGTIIEAIDPWYTLVRRTSTFDCINKDRN